jgi:hypothetical protein
MHVWQPVAFAKYGTRPSCAAGALGGLNSAMMMPLLVGCPAGYNAVLLASPSPSKVQDGRLACMLGASE